MNCSRKKNEEERERNSDRIYRGKTERGKLMVRERLLFYSLRFSSSSSVHHLHLVTSSEATRTVAVVRLEIVVSLLIWRELERKWARNLGRVKRELLERGD